MFYSFRNRLFAISLTLLAIFMLAGAIYLHQILDTWTKSRVESDLGDRAHLIVNALETTDNNQQAARLAEALGGPTDQRITLVDIDGTVLADTYLDEQGVAEAENHADRAEVRAAFDDGYGIARRHSASVGTDMLYVAIPTDDGQSVLRLALPLQELDDALSHLRLLLLLGAILGIGVAILMSSVASRMMSKILQQVLDSARTETDVDPVDSPKFQSSPDTHAPSLHQVTRTLEETLKLLVQQRNRFRAVLDGMTEGVIATDDELQVTLNNSSVRHILGIDDIDGQSLQELLPAQLVESIVDDEQETVEFEPPQRPQRRIRIRTTPRPDGGGYILVFHDVTTIRRLETMRRDFVANVSHELKTPVTIIRANAETLLDGALQDRQHARSFTEGIERNAERLSRLISDLLDLSQIEAGQMDFDIEDTALSEVTSATIADIEGRSIFDKATVESDVDDALQVRADFDALHRVLLNLVANAAKYGPDAGVVEIRARSRRDMVLVEVCDDGPGIAPEHRDRLFERFYRVDPGRTLDMGGTGLGLAIVKHLVASMDGEVGYRPREGGGSIFWFTLPRA